LGSTQDFRAGKRTGNGKEDHEEREDKEDDAIRKRTILSKHKCSFHIDACDGDFHFINNSVTVFICLHGEGIDFFF
jgi:hypothetical protein